jgi:hypothetical protein
MLAFGRSKRLALNRTECLGLVAIAAPSAGLQGTPSPSGPACSSPFTRRPPPTARPPPTSALL